MQVFPLTSAWSTTLTKFHKSPAIENSTAQNHFMQQYRYLKYSTTFIMFCLLVHGIFMYLIVTYAIYFKQYFLLMFPHSTFFWNSNICVFFLPHMMIILNRAHPTTEGRLDDDFFFFFLRWLDPVRSASKVTQSWWQKCLPPHSLQSNYDLASEQLLRLPGL